MKNLQKRILVGITGRNPKQLKNKIKEIDKLKIEKSALFLEFLSSKQRKEIYEFLLDSNIKKSHLFTQNMI